MTVSWSWLFDQTRQFRWDEDLLVVAIHKARLLRPHLGQLHCQTSNTQENQSAAPTQENQSEAPTQLTQTPLGACLLACITVWHNWSSAIGAESKIIGKSMLVD